MLEARVKQVQPSSDPERTYYLSAFTVATDKISHNQKVLNTYMSFVGILKHSQAR